MESIEFFIPSPKFLFVSIGDLKKIESKRIIDFIAIIKNIGPLKTYSDGGKKLDLTLADPTGTTKFTIWREMATKFPIDLLQKYPKSLHILRLRNVQRTNREDYLIVWQKATQMVVSVLSNLYN